MAFTTFRSIHWQLSQIERFPINSRFLASVWKSIIWIPLKCLPRDSLPLSQILTFSLMTRRKPLLTFAFLFWGHLEDGYAPMPCSCWNLTGDLEEPGSEREALPQPGKFLEERETETSPIMTALATVHAVTFTAQYSSWLWLNAFV